ncbi:Hypothetical predicted protein [Pelobates cultripes]|uniref:Uncharacterized protein n=1 Tax=Pelobates cultripes TaxID=61616 RepID=A0AAD1R374_PELCU|nr:Hypothetical predicted protein [Pelobates cultripes]
MSWKGQKEHKGKVGEGAERRRNRNEQEGTARSRKGQQRAGRSTKVKEQKGSARNRKGSERERSRRAQKQQKGKGAEEAKEERRQCQKKKKTVSNEGEKKEIGAGRTSEVNPPLHSGHHIIRLRYLGLAGKLWTHLPR